MERSRILRRSEPSTVTAAHLRSIGVSHGEHNCGQGPQTTKSARALYLQEHGEPVNPKPLQTIVCNQKSRSEGEKCERFY
jgi:hypothetical protein